MASSRNNMLQAVALCTLLLVATVIADEAGGGWQDNIKDKAGKAADKAKSWKNWAFGKINEKWNEGPNPNPSDKLGGTTTRTKARTSGGTHHPHIPKPQKHGPTEL